METRTVALDSLFKDGLFDIPAYQRSYSWEEPQLQDLLEDLLYMPAESSHFFGNIILDETDEQFRTDRGRRFDVYQVVDGQQRLTSALIFLRVAAEQDEVVADLLEEDNLVFPVTERPRLLPQDQDREFFRDRIFGEASIETETPSQERLLGAYEYFEEAFRELPDDTPIQTLVERLRYDCRVNVVEIDGESEAASIFESLNDRGKPLSALDKTKSLLMYMDNRSSNTGALEEIIKERFGSIYNELFVLSTGHERINEFDEESFQRFHWGLYDGYDSDEYYRSYETLKNRLRENYRSGDHDAVQTEIDDYVQDLREAASAFAALFEPAGRPAEVETPLRRVLELGRLANVLPVLMASQLKFGDDEPEKMARIVDACETLVFRMYAIDNRRSNTGRGRLVKLAHEIHTDPSIECEEIVHDLDSITEYYTSDERFERNLRDPEFYRANTSRDIKYLFYHYGQQIEKEIGEELLKNLPQILSSDFQVEHVLAQKIDESHVPDGLEGEFEEYVHRLGNLTVASRYWNNSYGNLPFSEKKRAGDGRETDYESSAIRVQRELAEFESFGKAEIDRRQNELVEFALDEWGIDPPEIEEADGGHPEEFAGYVPDDFFDRLTEKQEAFFRILLEEDDWVLNEEIVRRMEEEYGLSTSGRRTTAGVLAGLSTKHTQGYRRSITNAQWAGDQYQFTLDLDQEQRERFQEAFGELETFAV